MTLWQCTYLHGFLSSGHSVKANWFEDKFTALSKDAHPLETRYELLRPTYPQLHPQLSIDFLRRFLDETLKQTEQACLIGSSLGGFYARFLAQEYQLPYILINPALDPVRLLSDFQGEYTNPNTGETLNVDMSYANDLKRLYIESGETAPGLLLLDRGDEVISYEETLTRFNTDENHPVRLFDGGDHAFQHLDQAWSDIEGFLHQHRKD
ncbi:YqiA/YcfP family alpha/beta fold hydrolase [Thiomicrorhabdus sp. zzn3]|uniref:YqiA/YcfP family alpha/beta fold hydrolase n=1 Tax=Thiomicrorhabdus sp. zzn3 TaxID=3039775 RepID=UPI0024365681|nr:YqiA/YcfP family alpha/beta fold hydrolase [Thiomicrorhabdus sp. zzn3]MDG6778017.1 YqiA/YcfP family alpha/beta fold hydrolase [Thiomicrorhabdus sp. zzn3]